MVNCLTISLLQFSPSCGSGTLLVDTPFDIVTKPPVIQYDSTDGNGSIAKASVDAEPGNPRSSVVAILGI